MDREANTESRVEARRTSNTFEDFDNERENEKHRRGEEKVKLQKRRKKNPGMKGM